MMARWKTAIFALRFFLVCDHAFIFSCWNCKFMTMQKLSRYDANEMHKKGQTLIKDLINWYFLGFFHTGRIPLSSYYHKGTSNVDAKYWNNLDCNLLGIWNGKNLVKCVNYYMVIWAPPLVNELLFMQL